MAGLAARICVTVDLVLLIVLVIWRPFGPVGMLIASTVLLTGAAGGLLLGSSADDRRAAAPADPVRAQWDRAAEHHRVVLTAYGAYELDPAMLLQYPAMWDLSAPPIIDFHDALELVGNLSSDEYPGPKAAQEYVDAVSMLRSDWAKADRYARSTGTANLADADAQACDRALKLLRHADGTEGAERAAYLEQVLSTVDALGGRGVIKAPERIQEELAVQVRRAIEK
ncbi:hypothetical protein HLA97_07000 [Gordonia araii NBRC 100433]|nr:hypothetical protein [Gordonia araii NBRC 100433]